MWEYDNFISNIMLFLISKGVKPSKPKNKKDNQPISAYLKDKKNLKVDAHPKNNEFKVIYLMHKDFMTTTHQLNKNGTGNHA